MLVVILRVEIVGLSMPDVVVLATLDTSCWGLLRLGAE